MSEPAEGIRGVPGRIDGRKYCGVPDGHRTTFVAGMADMLDCLPAALVNYNLEALERSSMSLNKILKFMGTFETDSLRKLFDEYMAEDPNRMNYMAASSFLAMLIAKSGLSAPAPKGQFRTILDWRRPVTRWEWVAGVVGGAVVYIIEPMIENAIFGAHFEGALVAWLRGSLGALIGIFVFRLVRK